MHADLRIKLIPLRCPMMGIPSRDKFDLKIPTLDIKIKSSRLWIIHAKVCPLNKLIYCISFCRKIEIIK